MRKSKSIAKMAGGGNTGGKGMFSNLDDEDASELLDTGTGLVTDAIGVIGSKSKYKGAATGKLIGSGIGTAAGLAIAGPIGAKIGGAVLGAVGSLIGGGNDQRHIDQDEEEKTRRQYSNYNLGTNIDMYGNTFEDGGSTDVDEPEQSAEPAAPPKRLINVEKGELMIDPNSFKVVRKFTNPNRYSAHKDKQYDEPLGNFVQVDQGMIIIPKKLAPRYERGDHLTKKSIVLQILSDQANDPMHNVPEEEKPEGYDPDDTPQAKKGGRFMGINPAHKGYCTPMTKSTCTPKRKALAMTLKKHHGFHEEGGEVYGNGGGVGDPPLILKSSQNPYKVPKPLFGFLDNNTTPELPWPEVYPTPDGKPYIAAAKITNGAFQPTFPSPDPIMRMDTPIDRTVFPDKTASTVSTKKKVNWNAVGRKALSDLPIFMQMAQSLQGDPYLQHNPNVGFDAAIGDANQLPEDISIAGNLAANNRSYSTAIRGIDNSSSPSTRAEKSQLLATKIAGDNNAYANKTNTDVGLRSSKLTQLLNLKVNQGASNAADNVNYMNEARMDKAARENNFDAGLANFTTNNAQAQNDKERVKALNSILHTVQVDPYAQELIRTHPGLNEFAINFMLDGKGSFDDAYREWLQPKAKKDEVNTYNIQKTDVKGRTSTATGTRTKEYK